MTRSPETLAVPGRALLLTAALALLASGCAFGEWRLNDPLRRGITLEEAQHEYTVHVRWSHFEEAARYVAFDARDAFLRDAPNFRKLRFSEYESGKPEMDPETASKATVHVKYYGYTMASPIEIAVDEVQLWERTGSGNAWQVRPTFTNLDRIIARTN